MLDRTHTVIDERFADTKEHKVAMTMQSLKSAAGCLYELSMQPEYRDIMIDDLGSLSDVLLALNLVWSRVKAREEA